MGKDRILEYKVFPMELKKDDSLNDGEFRGHSAAFGNVDSWGDVIELGAFKQTLRGDKVRPLFFMHTPFETVGIAVNSTDEFGLITLGKYNMAVSKSVDVYEFHKQGAYGDLSIGYTAIKFEYETRKGVRIRILKEIQLFEISILPKGYAANPKAFVTELKNRHFENISDDDIMNGIRLKINDIDFMNKLKTLFDEPSEDIQSEKSLEIPDKSVENHLLKFNENLTKLNNSIKEA